MMKVPLPDISEARRMVLMPEERLLLAVVDSAYWDLRSSDPVRQHTARGYFLADDDRHTFGFVAICQHFRWSPSSIRMQLGSLLEVCPAQGSAAAC